MAIIPCYTDTCTVDLSQDAFTGQLMADAKISAGIDIGGSSLIPIGLSTDADFNKPSVVVTTKTHDVTFDNPFECDAMCLYTLGDLKLLGNRRAALEAPESFYVIASADLVITGASHIYNQSDQRMDFFGSWSGDTAIHGANPQTNMQFSTTLHALFRVPAAGSVTVTNRLTQSKKFHFDMTSDTGGDGGVAFLHPFAAFWPEAPTS